VNWKGKIMAVRLLGSINKVINRTTTEILDDQLINKITGVITTFLKTGVEAIRDITAETESDTDDEDD
jgi:hypothetical protein